MLIGMADAMLTEIAAVESAEELDQVLQGLLGPLLGGLMQPGAAEVVVADPADS
jgi:hypothetical protein